MPNIKEKAIQHAIDIKIREENLRKFILGRYYFIIIYITPNNNYYIYFNVYIFIDAKKLLMK